MNTFARLTVALCVMLPMSVMANSYFIDKAEAVINWGFWSILIGAIAGGAASTFIKTEVDTKLSHDRIAKMVIGSALGFFACLSWSAYYPETTMMKLALPSFVLGCLGAPIIVFLLTWASDANTFSKASKKLNEKLGLEGEEKKNGHE